MKYLSRTPKSPQLILIERLTYLPKHASNCITPIQEILRINCRQTIYRSLLRRLPLFCVPPCMYQYLYYLSIATDDCMYSHPGFDGKQKHRKTERKKR